MNAWLVGAGGLMLAMVPAGVACFRGEALDRLAGLEMAGVLTSLLLLALAEAFHRDIFLDVALATALLAFGGGLVFARFLERWL